MNGRGTALQRVYAVGATVAVLWVLGVGAVGPTLVQGSPLRAQNEPVARPSIVDGTDASITEFPFQVALYNPHAGSLAKGFFCGGVILGPRSVGTAAHCLIGERGQRSQPAEIEVLAGSTYLEPADPGSVQDPVVAATVDPAFNPSTSDYDVGVLRLAHPLWSGAAPVPDGSDAIAPLGLAGSHTAPATQRSTTTPAGQAASTPSPVVVSGWGDLNPAPGGAPSYPLRLHKVSVPLVSTGLCEEAYATIEQAITPRMLCAGGGQPGGPGGPDSCYGDSGGPLVAAGPGSPVGDVLVGLVDFGNGCAQADYPGVYIRVADPAVARFLSGSSPLASDGRRTAPLCETGGRDRAGPGSPRAGGQRVRRGGDRRRHHRRGSRAGCLHARL